MKPQDRELLERAFAQLSTVVGECATLERTADKLVRDCSKLAIRIDAVLREQEQLELPFK